MAFGQAENGVFKKVIEDYVLKDSQPNIQHSSITLLVIDSPKYMRDVSVNGFLKFREKYKNLKKRHL